ncbi:MAG: hypothetical protein RLZZ436_1667 [Planctomycetota bacterium]
MSPARKASWARRAAGILNGRAAVPGCDSHHTVRALVAASAALWQRPLPAPGDGHRPHAVHDRNRACERKASPSKHPKHQKARAIGREPHMGRRAAATHEPQGGSPRVKNPATPCQHSCPRCPLRQRTLAAGSRPVAQEGCHRPCCSGIRAVTKLLLHSGRFC